MLTFDEPSHTYVLDGRLVPSVTQVLACLEDFERIPYAVLEAARIRGQYVHEACALLVRDELDWSALDVTLVPYLVGAKRFLDETGLTVIASECRVVSEELALAGTLDLVGIWRTKECVFDFKATAIIPKSVGPQLALYESLYRSHYGGGKRLRYCVHLMPNDYRVRAYLSSNDMHIGLSCLNVFNFKSK